MKGKGFIIINNGVYPKGTEHIESLLRYTSHLTCLLLPYPSINDS